MLGDSPSNAGGTAFFRRLAARTAAVIRSPWALLSALAIVILWAVVGPHFGWSSAHQLMINTFATIVTFLIVLLIQNTQSGDSKSLTDEQLGKLEKEFRDLGGDDRGVWPNS